MDLNQKLKTEKGESFFDLKRYKRLFGKLFYLIIITPDMSFEVGVTSQFMQAPCIGHCNLVMHILRYLKKDPKTRFVI